MTGIVDTIKLAGVLVLAIPAALAGLELLFVRGQPTIGASLLVLAVALVVVQRWLTLPSDLPGLAAKRVPGTVIGDSDDDADERGDAAAGTRDDDTP